MRILIAFLLCVPPPAIEVHGLVTEVGANSPVGDAEITVEAVPDHPVPTGDLKQVAKTTSDLQGAFRTVLDKPGTYFVRARKAGYTDDGRDPAGENASDSRRVTLDKDHPSAEVRFRLARPGELRGLVVDDDTGKPIANFHVFPIGLLYYHGGTSQIGGHNSVTNSEGRFVTTGLRPGRYVVEIGPQNLGKEEFLTHFTEADLQASDRDYQRSYWPGGGGLDLVLPVQVLSGGVVDVGTIQARKVPYYRIHVKLPAGGCKEGEKVFLDTQTREFIGGGAGGEAVCGKDYLLRNYQPGSYELYAMAGNSAEDRMRAIVPVYVADKNVEVTIPLGRGVDIDGRVVIADGSAKPPMDAIKVHMWSTGNIQFADEREPAMPDAEGNFRFPNRPLVRVRVWVTGLGSGFVVRELRYNGSHVADNIFALNPNAPQNTLEMVVDDKPASLTGTVTGSDTPIARPHVVLIRWPAPPGDVFLSAKIIDGGDGGQFQYTGLAPGEYRILAVSPDTADKLDEPHVLERLLSSAERVELTAGGSQTLALKVTDPSR